MKLMLVEGTPQEMSEMKRLGFFDFEKAATSKSFSDEPVAPDELTEDVIVDGFNRGNQLNKEYKSLISAIHKGGSKGVRTSELVNVTGLSHDYVKSAMRNFAKRFKNTPGWPKGKSVFEQTWTGLENIYRMRPEMRAVIDKGSVVV
jgi:hypothetical protein